MWNALFPKALNKFNTVIRKVTKTLSKVRKSGSMAKQTAKTETPKIKTTVKNDPTGLLMLIKRLAV